MKRYIGIILVAFVVSPFLKTAPADAGTCTFTNQSAFADGQVQGVSISGCDETTSGTGPVGSTVSGSLSLSDGLIAGKEETKGIATVNLGGQVAFSVTATMPSFFAGPSGNEITIGNVIYNVSNVDFAIKGTAFAQVVNPDQALGAFIHLGFTPTFPSGTSFSFTCGSGFTVCGGINNVGWFVEDRFNVVPLQVLPAQLTIDAIMSMQLQLSSGINLSDNPKIDASDPFNITSMELLDANGLPIPGVSFVGDDGTIFLNAADTVTPLPGALPLFATGLGALRLLSWRRKRKNVSLAA